MIYAKGIPLGEERLINFSVLIIEITNELPNTRVGNHLPCEIVLLVLWTTRSLAKPFYKIDKIKIFDFISQGESGQLIRSGTSVSLNYGEASRWLSGENLERTSYIK